MRLTYQSITHPPHHHSAGRTKAERRLRKELKALIKGQTDGGVNLKPIARIRSPFKGRCGTPRQGLLAPNAR